MNKNNVFNQDYCPWRWVSNWWKNIRLFFRQFKWAYQRATRGFADMDTWSMDSWLLNLFHDSLYYLADNHCGYPGTEQFPDDESWTEYLKEMADKFYQADEWNNYFPTPEENKWYAWVNAYGHGDENPYIRPMIDESLENQKKRQAAFKEAWEMMGDIFYHLWD